MRRTAAATAPAPDRAGDAPCGRDARLADRHEPSRRAEIPATGFPHLDYVNPEAPKGGRIRLDALGSFDSFNPIVSKGDVAEGLGLLYETLTSPTMDETSTGYGRIADAVSFPADFSSVTYRINPKARWHDGKPITRRRRDLELPVAEGGQCQPGLLLPPRRRRRGDGRARGDLHLRREEQSRTAEHRRPASRPAEALVDGQGRERAAARHRGDDARGAARLRPLQIASSSTRAAASPTSA